MVPLACKLQVTPGILRLLMLGLIAEKENRHTGMHN